MIAPDWQKQLLEKVVACAATFSDVRQIAAFGSSVTGEMDAWSDLDVRLVVSSATYSRMFPAVEWLAPLGPIWAISQRLDPHGGTTRLVFRDGRRLDLRFEIEGDAVPEASLPESDSALMGLEREFRFIAVLAIAKLARNDLLIGAHLVLELERFALVVAMLLRDRDLGTTTHRRGGLHNEVVSRIGGPGETANDWLSRIEQAMMVFGDLAGQLDTGWRADWEPLRGFLDRAQVGLG